MPLSEGQETKIEELLIQAEDLLGRLENLIEALEKLMEIPNEQSQT